MMKESDAEKKNLLHNLYVNATILRSVFGFACHLYSTKKENCHISMLCSFDVVCIESIFR
jgi:hypothetical protein